MTSGTKRRSSPSFDDPDQGGTSEKGGSGEKRRRAAGMTPEYLLRGMERHNLRLIEKCKIGVCEKIDQFCSQVLNGTICMYEKKPQPGMQPIRLCREDGPQIVVDKKDNFILFYGPQFWGNNTQEYLLDAIDTLDTAQPFQMDSARVNADKRVMTGSKEGSRRAEWGIYTHGIAQQLKCKLRPSPSLRLVGGKSGIQARKAYLDARALNDGKINHMTKIIHESFHAALIEAKDCIRVKSLEAAGWMDQWTTNYLSQAIFENRQTGLHRDSRGSPYCADFLYILGDFQGGDLFLPDLNIKIEWLPNAACMFDGRTFAHEVLPWKGSRRLCMVNYIWKTAMDDLGVKLPKQAPKLSEILSRVKEDRAARKAGSELLDRKVSQSCEVA
ncbi:hypothetical protein FRC11_008721 [Ceratobasidium sp. 423]|nr:hypothetical protein FRC11_008721 [Ceratobasidium sp. 423]